ncbi:hypothetical protein QBC39DRAFT_329238 [Podospora conica]|nr:hypothetical protein QBC39DRAFT_329238 [Schizothecium conicum]
MPDRDAVQNGRDRNATALPDWATVGTMESPSPFQLPWKGHRLASIANNTPSTLDETHVEAPHEFISHRTLPSANPPNTSTGVSNAFEKHQLRVLPDRSLAPDRLYNTLGGHDRRARRVLDVMLSHSLPPTRRGPPPPPPPPNGDIYHQIHHHPGRGNPGPAPPQANKAVVVAPPAGNAPLPPQPFRNGLYPFARIPRVPYLAAQRPKGSKVGSPLRHDSAVKLPIPTPSHSASSSRDGDHEDDSERSSDVERIHGSEQPVPEVLRLPPPMGGPGAHPSGSWVPPGSSFALSALSALRPRSRGSSRPASSAAATETAGGRRITWADVTDQRSRVDRLRKSMKKKRADLQARRRQFDTAQNEVMRLLGLTTFPPPLPTESSQEKHNLMKGARDEYHRVRDEYYRAEDAYGDEEEKLDAEEAELYRLEAELHRFPDNKRDDKNDGSAGVEEEETPVRSHKNDTNHVNNDNAGIQTTLDYDTKHVNINTGKPHHPPPSDTNHVPGTEKRDTPTGETVVNNNTGKDDGASSTYSYMLLGIDADRADDIHPLYQNLLDAVADREQAREDHTEMYRRREGILNDLEMDIHRERARTSRGNQLSDGDLLSLKSSLAEAAPSVAEFEKKFGIPIDQDDLEFLRDYKTEEESVRRVMEEAEHEVSRWRAICQDKGAMRKNPPYEEEFTILKGTSMATTLPEGNMALNQRPAPNLAHPAFSTLLSNPMHVLELKTPKAALKEVLQMPQDSPGVALRKMNCMKEFGISSLMQKPQNKTDFINQWLIHRLRTSPMEIELLFSISTAFLRIMNLRRWQEDVLRHWKTDDAAGTRGPSPQRAQTTRDEVEVDEGSGESEGSDGSDGSDGSEGDESSDSEGAHSQSCQSGSKVKGSTKTSP